MKSTTVIALLVAAAAAATTLVMCGRTPESVPVAAPETPAIIDHTPAAPDTPVGESCSADCGNGVIAAITCAEGETPVCNCQATPQTQCLPPAQAPQP